MLTTAEQYRIIAKTIEDLCEIKKEYLYRFTEACERSAPDDYRNTIDSVMENAKNECGRWAHTAQGAFYWEVWEAFHRLDTPMYTEAIRRVLRKKLEIDLEL
ncbi:hypothetical protein [Pseudomonas sp.]|uniref:hypothetical protein n=1 Tax=Pseudomonas sp. TaxID=306 RepID=UPI003BB6039F